jgi:tetratricopeptide (TPR) repeat protein
VGTSPASAAAGPAKVFLLPYQPIARQASPELCAQVTKAIASELGNSDDVTLGEVVEPDDDTPESPPDETAPAPARSAVKEPGADDLGKALKLTDQGVGQVKKMKFDPAIKSLSEAIRLYDSAAPAVTDVGPIQQAHLNLAVAYWRRGLEEEAQAEMAQAVRLDFDYKPDPKEYWPLFLRIYDQQWRKTLRQPRGKVSVEATVPGAEVFFDGKSRGVVPLLLTNVVPGRHFLRVVKDGAGTFGALVEVPSESTLDVTAELGGGAEAQASLGPVAAAITKNLVDDAAVRAAQQLGKQAGAAYVLFGGIRKQETVITVHTFMLDVGSAAVGRLVDLELDLDLLSASVESFKLVEEVGMRTKDFGDKLPAGATAVIRGLEASGAVSATEVDYGAPVPDASSKVVPRQERGPVEGVGGEAGEEGGSRALLGGDDDKKARAKARDGASGDKRAGRSDDDYKPRRPLYMVLATSPVLLGGVVLVAVVAVAAVAVVGTVAAVGGGAGAYWLLAPAQTAQVQTTWPK